MSMKRITLSKSDEKQCLYTSVLMSASLSLALNIVKKGGFP